MWNYLGQVMEVKIMKQLFYLLLASLFFVACCTKTSESQNEQVVVEDNVTEIEKVEPVEIKKDEPIGKQIAELSNEDPRRQKIATLTWRLQYEREKLRTLELSYLAKCYQDKKYRDSLAMIEQLNKQIRAMMLL